MKNIKSIASITSLALLINFGGMINGQSDNLISNHSISYAHTYSERSSKDNYTKFKYKYNRGTLRSISGVKINGVIYTEASGKDIKEGY